MTELIFNRSDALKAIRRVRTNGLDWLYENYPKPNGQMRRSSTRFLMHEGLFFPVKPLGRLANEIAGRSMTNNPKTNVFWRHFENLDFQLKDITDESKRTSERQRGLAEVWLRPGQAKFRRAVFELFGARCLVTGCEALQALEAAHVLPVSLGGGDEVWNGIPLRADLHRLFDDNEIILEPITWKLSVNKCVHKDYGQYHGLDLSAVIAKIDCAPKLAAALQKRLNKEAKPK